VGQLGRHIYKQGLLVLQLESGKQVVWPVSSQSLVDWRLGEGGDKIIGESSIVLDAVATDFFFY
jgi:hypothetical protein